jgi:hypothetical protein
MGSAREEATKLELEREFANPYQNRVFAPMETHGQYEREFVNSPVQNPVFPFKFPFFFRPV